MGLHEALLVSYGEHHLFMSDPLPFFLRLKVVSRERIKANESHRVSKKDEHKRSKEVDLEMSILWAHTTYGTYAARAEARLYMALGIALCAWELAYEPKRLKWRKTEVLRRRATRVKDDFEFTLGWDHIDFDPAVPQAVPLLDLYEDCAAFTIFDVLGWSGLAARRIIRVVAEKPLTVLKLFRARPWSRTTACRLFPQEFEKLEKLSTNILHSQVQLCQRLRVVHGDTVCQLHWYAMSGKWVKIELSRVEAGMERPPYDYR